MRARRRRGMGPGPGWSATRSWRSWRKGRHLMADRPRVEDVIRDMSDDALAETAIEMKAEGYRLMRMADLALHELGNRMEDRGASKLDTEHWNGTLRPGPLSHHVDPEKMEKLRQHLT